MYIKCNIIFLFCLLVGLSQASVFRGNGKGQHPDMCEYNNIIWKKGTSTNHPTKCCMLTCHEDLTFTGYCCGTVSVTPDLCLKEDKSLPYPGCCPQPVPCSKENNA